MTASTPRTHTIGSLLADLGALAASAEGREIIATHLLRAIRRSKIGGPLLDKLQLMYAYFRDPAEPMSPKLLMGAALLYLIIPNDLIPDFVPLLGLTDDFAAITIVWNQTRDILLNYAERRQQRAAVLEETA